MPRRKKDEKTISLEVVITYGPRTEAWNALWRRLLTPINDEPLPQKEEQTPAPTDDTSLKTANDPDDNTPNEV